MIRATVVLMLIGIGGFGRAEAALNSYHADGVVTAVDGGSGLSLAVGDAITLDVVLDASLIDPAKRGQSITLGSTAAPGSSLTADLFGLQTLHATDDVEYGAGSLPWAFFELGTFAGVDLVVDLGGFAGGAATEFGAFGRDFSLCDLAGGCQAGQFVLGRFNVSFITPLPPTALLLAPATLAGAWLTRRSPERRRR